VNHPLKVKNQKSFKRLVTVCGANPKSSCEKKVEPLKLKVGTMFYTLYLLPPPLQTIVEQSLHNRAMRILASPEKLEYEVSEKWGLREFLHG